MATMYENYARLRDARGMKDLHVSKKSGVATSTISEWKTGKHELGLHNLRRIAAVLDCTIDDLIEGVSA